MILDELELALYYNNLKILDKIKEIKDVIDGTSSADIDEIKTPIDNINNVELINIKQLIEDLDVNLSNHTNDTVIHVTQDDKDLWNTTLQNAKDYAKILFDGVTSFTIEIVDVLPETDINAMTIYFMRNDRDNKSDYYEEYMYINNSWELIGNTRINLEPYILRTEVEKMLEDYLLKKDSHKHDNLDVLNEISELNGLLNYKGKPIAQEIITDEDIKQAIKDMLETLNKEES